MSSEIINNKVAGIEFVSVPPGSFLMGDNRISNEAPAHKVTITKGFLLSKYEITQAQWQSIMGENPSLSKGNPDLPVENVSPAMCQTFINKLNTLYPDGGTFRLPTEAEWEYACRAGTTTAYSFGDDVNKLGEYAWYAANSGGKTHPVGLKKPNPWGLYDMHGNVWEWTYDRFVKYKADPAIDPRDPDPNVNARTIAFRGGCWFYDADFCRSAYRLHNYGPGDRYNNLGLRIVREIAGSESVKGKEMPPEKVAARVKNITDSVTAVQASYQKCKDQIADTIRVKIIVQNELLLAGEDVIVTFETRSASPPNPILEVTQDFYKQDAKSLSFNLQWTKNSTGDGYFAKWSWRPPACGNYLIHWKCGIGGDIPEFWRNFSAVDKNWVVMMLNLNANDPHSPIPTLHELHMPSNLFEGTPLWYCPGSAEEFARVSRNSRQFGDASHLCIWLSNTYMSGKQKEDVILFNEPEAVQRAMLDGYAKILPFYGYYRPANSIGCSGMSNSVSKVMRETGYLLAGTLYAEQNWADAGGSYEINQWGMPSRPFFISKEDYRKTGDGGPNGMVGIQQCHRHTVLCRDYNCLHALEAGIDYMIDRYQDIERPRTINDMIQSRELDFLETFIQAAGMTDTPLFFDCGVEFAGFDFMPEEAQIQKIFLKYVAKRAAVDHLAIVTPQGVADFFRSHYTQTPESVLYLPDLWAGRTDTGYQRIKPPIYPDTMEIENHLFKAIFRKGETLPYAYYDYTIKWDYPHWDKSDIPRDPGGSVIPNTDNRFRVVPPILDTRNFKLSTELNDNPASSIVTITIDAKIPQKNIALAVWDIPREFSLAPSNYKLTGASRFVPIRAAYTGNLCGFVIADIKKGKNIITLSDSDKPRTHQTIDMVLDGNILAKVFDRDGESIAYIYTIGKSDKVLKLSLPHGKTALLYPYTGDSDEPKTIAGDTAITIEPRKNQRIKGLTYDELLRSCKTAKPLNITVHSPQAALPDLGL